MATRGGGGGPPPGSMRGGAPSSMYPPGMRGGGPAGAAPGGAGPVRGRGMAMPPGAHVVKVPMNGGFGGPGGGGAAMSMGAVRGGGGPAGGGVPPPAFRGKAPLGMPAGTPGAKTMPMPMPPPMQQQQRFTSPPGGPGSAGPQRGPKTLNPQPSRSGSPAASMSQPQQQQQQQHPPTQAHPPQFAVVNGKKMMVPPGTKLPMGGPPQPPGMPMGTPGAKKMIMMPQPPPTVGAGPGTAGPSRGPSPPHAMPRRNSAEPNGSSSMSMHPATGPAPGQPRPPASPPPAASSSPPPQQQQQRQAEHKRHKSALGRGFSSAMNFLKIGSDSDDDRNNRGPPPQADASAQQGPPHPVLQHQPPQSRMPSPPGPALRGPNASASASVSQHGPLPSPTAPQPLRSQPNAQRAPMTGGVQKVMMTVPQPARSGSVGGAAAGPGAHPPNAFPPGKVLVKGGPPPPSMQPPQPQPQQQQQGPHPPGTMMMGGAKKMIMVPNIATGAAGAGGGSAARSRSGSAAAGPRTSGPDSQSSSITLLSPPGPALMPSSLPQQQQQQPQYPPSPAGPRMVKRMAGPPPHPGASQSSPADTSPPSVQPGASIMSQPHGVAGVGGNAVRVPSSTVLKGEALPEAGVRSPGRGRRHFGESSEDSDAGTHSGAAAASDHLRLSPSDDDREGGAEATEDEEVDADALSSTVERRNSPAAGDRSAHGDRAKESTALEPPSMSPPLHTLPDPRARGQESDPSASAAAAASPRSASARRASTGGDAATRSSRTAPAPVRQTATAAARAAAAAAKRRDAESAAKAKTTRAAHSQSGADTAPKEKQQQQQQRPLHARPAASSAAGADPLSPQEEDATQKPSSNERGSHSTTSSPTPSDIPSDDRMGRNGVVRSPKPHPQQPHSHARQRGDDDGEDARGDGAPSRRRQQSSPGSASTRSRSRRAAADHFTSDEQEAPEHHSSSDQSGAAKSHARRGTGGSISASPNRGAKRQPQRSHRDPDSHRNTAVDADVDGVDSGDDGERSDSGSEQLASRDLYRLVKVLRDTNADLDAEEARQGRQRRRSSAWRHERGARRADEEDSDRDGGDDGRDEDEGSASWGLRSRRKQQQQQRHQRSTLPASTVGIPWRYTGARRASEPFATPPPVRRPLGYINVGGGHYARVGGSPYTRSRGRPRAQSVGAVPLDRSNLSPSGRYEGLGWRDEAATAGGVPRALSPSRRDPETSTLVDARHNAVVAELQASALLQSGGSRRASSVRGEGGGGLETSPAAFYYRAMQRQPFGHDASPLAGRSGRGAAAAASQPPAPAALDDTESSIADSQHPYCVPVAALLPVMRALSPKRGVGAAGNRYPAAGGGGSGSGGGGGGGGRRRGGDAPTSDLDPNWPPSSVPTSSLGLTSPRQHAHPQQAFQFPSASMPVASSQSDSAAAAAAAAAAVQEPILLASPRREAAAEQSTASEAVAGTFPSQRKAGSGAGPAAAEARDRLAALRRSSFFDLLYDSPVSAASPPAPPSVGRPGSVASHHQLAQQQHRRSLHGAVEPARLIPDSTAASAPPPVLPPPPSPAAPSASATQRSARVTQRSQSARSRVSNASSKGRSAAVAAAPHRPHNPNPDPYRPPSRTKEAVHLTRATIARLSTPQQRRGNAAAAALSPIARRSHPHAQHGETASSATAHTCSKWLDEILASTTVTATGVRAGGGAPGGIDDAAAGAGADALPVIDLRREFKPRVSDGVGVGGGGGPGSVQAASLSLRELLPADDFTRGFTGSRARPHVPGISFKHMTGARSATGSPPREGRSTPASAAAAAATTEKGVAVKTVNGVSEGLPFHLYSSIRTHDPTRKSPWALAPEREGLDVLPGQPALSRRRRIPVAGGGHAAAHDGDDDEDDGFGGGRARAGASRTVVEEVHLDEHRRPYLVVRPVPSPAEVEAQRATVERLARPKPVYRRAEESP